MPRFVVQCIVVLYECRWEDSSTLQALAQLSSADPALVKQVTLLIYDNSRIGQSLNLHEWQFGEVQYLHASTNGGIVAAYNNALEKAASEGTAWLLLLDQDTVPTHEMFVLLKFALSSALKNNVCAIVPKLVRGERVLSPQSVGYLHNKSIEAAFCGMHPGKMTALNSAACLKVEAVLDAGGFPREYWLDFVDHVMFHRLQIRGGEILILDTRIEHHMALDNLGIEMGLNRYLNMIGAEWMYVRETRAGGGPLIHRLRLLKRAFRHAVGPRDKRYAWNTLIAAMR